MTEQKRMTSNEVGDLAVKAGAIAQTLNSLWLHKAHLLDLPEDIEELLMNLSQQAHEVKEGLRVLENEKDQDEIAA